MPSLRQRSAAGFAVAGFMVIGAVVRLPLLGIGLWRDEASTYFDVAPDTLREVIRTVAFTEISPPGFFLVMHAWIGAFGSSEFVFKLPALIFGLSLIPAVYALARTTTGCVRVGMGAAAAATLAAEATYYSQEARPYTLTALVACLFMLSGMHALQRGGQLRPWAAVVVAATALMYVHYMGLLLVAAFVAVSVGLWSLGAAGVQLRYVVASCVAISLLFAPWLPAFVEDLGTGAPWVTPVPWSMRPRLVWDNLLYTVPFPSAVTALGPLRRVTIAILAAAAIVAIMRTATACWLAKGRLPVPGPAVLGAALLLGTALMAGMSAGRRFMFPFLPLGWVLVSWLVVAVWDEARRIAPRVARRGARWAVAASALAVLAMANIPPNAEVAGTEKSGARRLAADLRSAHRRDVLYVVNPDIYAPTLGYYLARDGVALHGFPRWTRPQVFSPHGYVDLWSASTVSEAMARIEGEAVRGSRQLALVQQRDPVDDMGGVPMSRAQDLLARLRDRYELLSSTEYPGRVESLTLYRFALRASAE